MASEGNITDGVSTTQNAGPEEGYSMKECKSSMESSFPDKSSTGNICKSEHCQVDKTENQALTKISENERQHQSIAVETGEDKIEAINDTNIEEPDDHIEDDGARDSKLACLEEPIIAQHVSSEPITGTKGEEDADSECNGQATIISEANVGGINEASLADIALTSKSQGEEDERATESCAKDEDIDTAIHVEDEFKDISLAGVQNKKEEMPSVPERGLKDPESIRSCDKLEHENISEEDASTVNVAEGSYVHGFEESFEAATKNGDNEDGKPENPPSNSVTGEASTEVKTEAGETLQEASHTACKDETERDKAENSACLNRDETEANEKDTIQMGVTETNEDSKINPEKYDGEKGDSWQKKDQEDEHGEQVILIPKKTEIAAPRENVEKGDEQKVHPVEKFEEEKDESAYIILSGETSISTEKSLPLAESISEIKSEESIFPENITDDLNSKEPMVEETGQPDSGEADKVSTTEVQEEHHESSKFCVENNELDEHRSETQGTENLVKKHMDSEAMVTTDTTTKSTNDTEELEKVPCSQSEDKIDIKGDEKIVTEEPKDREEATDKQLHETGKESVSEYEAPSGLSTMSPIRDETAEQTIQEESLKDGESTLIQKDKSHGPENNAEENKKAYEVLDLPKTTGGQDIYEQQIVEGSVEDTFQENEKEIQNLREDTGREIKGDNYVSDLPLELNQTTEEESDSNPRECSPAESKSSVESSSTEKPTTENISKPEHFQDDEIENQALTQISDNERQHQGKDVETGGDKVEATIDINTEESDRDIENDGAKNSRLANAEEPNLKVHEEINSMEKEMITLQKNEKTRPKGEEDADSERNEQATSISETNLGLMNEAPLPNLDLATESQQEEDERVIESCTKDEDTDTTTYVEDEFKEVNLTAEQNKKADMPSIMEGEHKDPESIGSSDNLEHEYNKEEDASTVNVVQSPYVHRVEECTHSNASENDNNFDDKSENPSSNLVTDGVSSKVVIEAGETQQEASYTGSKDKNIDVYGSAGQEINVPPVDGMAACLNRNVRGENEDELIQTELAKTNEDGRINPEIHNGEKIDNALTSKIQSEQNERVMESCAKDEHIDTTMHVEDEFKEINLPGVLEGGLKDPESIRSSDELDNENIREEDASPVNVAQSSYVRSFEESPLKAASRDGDNEDNKPDPVTDGASAEVEIEAGETLQEPSSTACKDETEMDKAEDSTCINRDETGANEKDIIQMRVAETNEDGKINPEKHEGKKRDPWQKIDQEDELGEEVILIPEKTETAAPRENVEKRDEQNIPPVEKIEEKDEATSTPDSGETSNSTEKSLPIESEETIFPEKIANDSNSEDPLVQEAGQPDSGETGKVSKVEAAEKHQESSEFCTETSQQEEHHYETQSTDSLVIKHMDSEAMLTTETIAKSTKDTEELDMVPESHSVEKIDIEGDEKIKPEEPKEMEEATDKQLCVAARESVFEDEAPSRSPTTPVIRDETVEESIEEESLKDGESTLIEKNDSHISDAEEEKKAIEAFDLPKAKGSQDTYEQHIIEGSVEETMNVQDNKKDTENTEDTGREINPENYVPGLPPEFIQNTGLGEGYSMTAQLDNNPKECSPVEWEGSVELSSSDKSPTENISKSDNCQADKIGGQALTEISENEKQHQKVVLGNDVGTGEDKVEAINNISIEEADHEIENDGAKISMLTSTEEPNLKVHEDNSSLEQHLELITYRQQQTSFEVIPESIVQDENTKSKGEEDADLESNEQASLAKPHMKTKSQGEEDERMMSCIKDEDTETTIHVEDEIKEPSVTEIQNKKADMSSILEGESKDLESIGSSDKLEHENNREEDTSTVNVVQSPYIHTVQESTSEAASKNGDCDNDRSESPSSNLLTDGKSTQVAIETGETLEEASYTACQDVTPVDVMDKAEDAACLNRDVRGDNEEDIIQTGLIETSDKSKANPEKHNGEKSDSWQENDQEDELGEQVILIPEKTEIAAPRENVEKRDEQNLHPIEKIEEEEKDEPTFIPDIRETSISTEKSLPLAESITKIESEETRVSEKNANSEDPLVQETGQPDSGEIGEISKVEAKEIHQEPSEFSTEINKQEERHYETESTDSLVVKHMDSEAITTPTKDTEELDKVPQSHSPEKEDIKGDEKSITKEPEETEEATDKQLHEAAKESASEDKAPSRLPTTASIKDEPIEQSFQEESPEVGESTLIEKNESHRSENDAEENKKSIEAFDPPKTTEGQDIYMQQSSEGSIEETINNFQDDGNKIQILRVDTSREIKGESNAPDLPPEFIQDSQKPVTRAKSVQKNTMGKKDSWQGNDQEDELGEQVILIPENTEIAAPRENVEKRDEQNLHPTEKIEEEEKDEPTSIPDMRETSISTEKSLPLAESITKIECEETTVSEKIADMGDPLVQDTGQPDSGETGEVSKVEAEEIHQESSEFCTEINKQEEHHYETESTDSLVVKHMDSEAITTPTKDTEELDKVPESYPEEKGDIKGDEKIIIAEPEEAEEATDKQLHEAAKESASEDKAPSRLPTTASIKDEPIEQSFQEGSPEIGESTSIEKNESRRSENDAEENKKSIEAFDPPKTTEGQDIYMQQISEGSIEETMNNFQDDGNKIQILRDDTGREIKGESHAPDLPPEFIQNTRLVETYSTTVQLDNNPNECSPAEFKSSMESSSPEKSPPENICKSEHFQPDKIENQAFTEVSEDERQHQEGVLSKDDETGGDKVEAINDISIEEPDQDIETDGAKISRPALVEEPNPEAHEEETSMENSSLDQHFELITDQHASSKVIVESMENEESTRTKGKQDVDLECNEQATSISETNFGLINEASLSNLDLTTNSQGEEDERVVNDLNSEDPLVQETGQPDSDETGKVSKIEAKEKHQESSKFCTKTNKQDEHHSETHSTDNSVIKHMDSEAMVTTETITKSTLEELEKAPESHCEEKIDIKGDQKIIPEEPNDREETIDKQSHKTPKESVSEDETTSKLPTKAAIRDETNVLSSQEKGLEDGESTLVEKNESHIPENDADEDEKAVEDNARCNDTDREIKGENYVPDLPPEFIQHGTADDTILCEPNQNVENPEKASDILPNKQEQSLFGEHDKPTPKEALTEDQDESAYSIDVADDNGDKSGEAKEKEKLEVPDMIPVGSKAKAYKDSENTTCTEGEETIARLEKISQKEAMKEEAKDIDGTKENKASNQEVAVTTASGQATIENILKECEPSETEASISKPEEETENTVVTLSSATVGTKTGKEYLEEDERKEIKMKDEVVVTESKGQIEATDLIEEKVSNTVDDCSEPKGTIEENNNNLVKGPSSIPGVLEKDSSSTNDSETEFLRVVDENTAIKEVHPVDKEQLEVADAAPDMMNLTTNEINETNSNCLGGADIAERQEEETNSEENRDMEVGEVVDQGEKISQDIKDKDLITGINHEKELTITDHQSVHTIIDSSMVPSNGEPRICEMSKMTENSPAKDDISCVETETPLITHTEVASVLGSSDNENEYSNERIQKHKDGDQLMPPDLKTETNISESDTVDREKGKRKQVDDLADQNEASKLEIEEDEKSIAEATKSVLQKEDLADKIEDSSEVIEVEREAANLSSPEESVDTETSKLQMEKGGDFVAKDESEETLHSSNNQIEGKDNNLQDVDSQFVQEVIGLQFEGDTETKKKPRCNDEELLNLSLDQDENTKAVKLTQEVHQRPGTADMGESRITSPAGETRNEVEVSTSEFTEQIESIKSTEEKESVALEDHTEHNMDNTDFSALKSPDASETCTEVSSSISKVCEKENEGAFIKKDEPITDDPKNGPVIGEIKETGLKNTGPGHIEYDKGSDIGIENKGETAIVTDNIKSDSIDIIERETENFSSEKKRTLEELNEECHLMMDSCFKETKKTTTVQHEKELITSSIPMSQDNPALLVEEKGALGNTTVYPMEVTDETAETYLVHSAENKSLQKEHEVVNPGGISESELVDITNECSNDGSLKLENEEKEEKLSVDASKSTASSTYKDSEATKGHENLDTTFESIFTNFAIEKAAIALETKDVSHENETADEFPSEKAVEAEDINKKAELASESMVEDQDEKSYQAKEDSNLEDHIFESGDNVPGQKLQGERELDMQVEVEQHTNVPTNAQEVSVTAGCTENALQETEKANVSGNILEHTPEPNGSLKEPDNLPAGYETVTAPNSRFVEETEKMDLMEDTESSTMKNLAKVAEDFSPSTTIEASEEGVHKEEFEKTLPRRSFMGSQGVEKDSKVEIFNKEDGINTFETLPCMPERKDVTITDKVKTCLDTIDTGDIQEKSSNSKSSRDKQSPDLVGEGGHEIDDTRDEAPTTGEKHEKGEDTSLTEMPNNTLQKPSVIQTEEDDPLRNKFSNSIDNQASDDQTYKNAETTFVVHTAEKKLPQSNHDVIKPEVSSELEIAVVENENANQEIQRQEDEDLCDLNSQGTISDSKDVKISRTEKGSGLIDQTGAGTLEQVKDQKPCIDITDTNDEQDADKFRSRSKIKIATESDASGNKHESTKTEQSELPAEKVHDGSYRAGGSKNIDEQMINYAVSSMKLQTLSGKDETVNQVKDHNLVFTKDLEATDSSKHTEIVDLGIGEDPTRRESSISDPTAGHQVLEGKMEKKIEAPLDDKPVEGSNLNEQCSETITIRPSLQAEEVVGMEVEKNSPLFAQLAHTANESAGREMPFREFPDGHLSEDFKMASSVVELKYEDVEDIEASQQNLSLDQNEEDTKGSSEMISGHDRAGVEAFSKDKTLDDQILLSRNSEQKLQTQSSSGTKIHEDSQKDSSDEVHGKGRAPDVVVQLEPHEKGEKEYINSLSESEQINEATESQEADKLQPEENQSEITTATGETINTVVSNEKVKEGQEAVKDFQQTHAGERDRMSNQETEESAIEYPIKKTHTTIQTINNDNQHEVSDANEKGEHENAKDNLQDDTEEKHVTEAATRLTHDVEKDQEVYVNRPQKGHVDSAEASEYTGEREIQKQEESSLGTADIKLSEKGDAESRKTKDVGKGPQNPYGEIMPAVQQINARVEGTQVEEETISLSDVLRRTAGEPPQADTHLDETTEEAAKTPKAETQCEESGKEEGGGDEGSKIEPMSLRGDSVMVKASRVGNVKVAHKKSHNILSGVGSKVKHSISKVKKAITGKSSHPKTPSPK